METGSPMAPREQPVKQSIRPAWTTKKPRPPQRERGSIKNERQDTEMNTTNEPVKPAPREIVVPPRA